MSEVEYYDPTTARHFIDSLSDETEEDCKLRLKLRRPPVRLSKYTEPIAPEQPKQKKPRQIKPKQIRKHKRKKVTDVKRKFVFPNNDKRKQSNINAYDMLTWLYENCKDYKVLSINQVCHDFGLVGYRGAVLQTLLNTNLVVNTDVVNEIKWVGSMPTQDSAIYFKQQCGKYYNMRACL